jgi:hypothetical protein
MKNANHINTIKFVTAKNSTTQAGAFAQSLLDQSNDYSGTFDSSACDDFVEQGMNQNTVAIPEKFQEVLDSCGDDAGRVTYSLLDGLNRYSAAHGTNVPPDVIEQALHNAYAVTLDDASASSDHSAAYSLQAESVIVAIQGTLVAAVPFAHYAPADIGSGEARIALLTHSAGDTTGRYGQNDSLDGVNSGMSYLGSARFHTQSPTDNTTNSLLNGKITKVQTDDDHCDQSGSAVKLVAGRSVVYYKGRQVASEISATEVGSSAVAGSFTDDGTSYVVAGSINTDTGVYALTVTPEIDSSAEFVIEALLDLERDDSLIPLIQSSVLIKPVFASSWRAYAQTSKESIIQFQNELGIQPHSESAIAINAQFANERHFMLLSYARRIAMANQTSFTLEYDARKSDMNISTMWRDLEPVLIAISQSMAEATNSHGATHIYVGKKLLRYFASMPRDIFTPSGVTNQPGIYRVGRLLGMYDIYYTPRGLTEATGAAQMMVIGRSNEVARSAFIMGDVSAPIMETLGKDKSLRDGTAFHAKNFTTLNPHKQTLNAAAMINVTGLPD